MKRTDALDLLRKHEAELRQLGVQRLFMFGSTAVDRAQPDSDVDLFFDYTKGELDLFDLMTIKERASALLGRPADIMTRDSIHHAMRERIVQSAVPVF
ncbi:nucleotidyltransferase family protein [Hyphomicrobium sp.]|jgi:hypothetical protein|uniref:nucleotidyltransferase family protein n=1 Tax=Hyphomicrobium sp. TaxID=82 RepID=UPI003563B24D